MRKFIVLMTFLAAPVAANAQFINPMKFDGSEAQKQEVIKYIKARVKKTYCDGPVNMCQETTLRMMEKQNLDAFKAATKATNKKIMDKVIETYCNGAIDMCDYATINMMYTQDLKASKQDLQW